MNFLVAIGKIVDRPQDHLRQRLNLGSQLHRGEIFGNDHLSRLFASGDFQARFFHASNVEEHVTRLRVESPLDRSVLCDVKGGFHEESLGHGSGKAFQHLAETVLRQAGEVHPIETGLLVENSDVRGVGKQVHVEDPLPFRHIPKSLAVQRGCGHIDDSRDRHSDVGQDAQQQPKPFFRLFVLFKIVSGSCDDHSVHRAHLFVYPLRQLGEKLVGKLRIHGPAVVAIQVCRLERKIVNELRASAARVDEGHFLGGQSKGQLSRPSVSAGRKGVRALS